MSLITTLFFFTATFVLLVLVERWIHRHLHGVALLVSGHYQVALYLYAVLLFPGVALHELSHWLVAGLLGVKVGKIKLLPERGRDGRVRLGSVQIGPVDVVRASLVGAAPLVTGSLVVLGIGYRIFDVGQTGQALLSGNPAMVMDALSSALQTPDMWLWLYLVFAIANAMLPSSADRQMWLPVILFLAIVASITYLAGGYLVVTSVAPVAVAGLRWLAAAFAITLAADAPFVVAIALAEWGVGALRGQRVYYK
jgi:hypothetical protein